MFGSELLDEMGQTAATRPGRRFGVVARGVLVTGALLATVGGTGAVVASASDLPTPKTPNGCIQLNGDYNACNVGNSGRGELPYGHLAGPYAPNDCIRVNGGDYTACNDGRRGLPRR